VTQTQDLLTSGEAADRRQAIFEDRYGAGSQDRLLSLLGQPCVSFAAIASEFGVTRERVRQWQLELLPSAPKGRERRRLCAVHQQRRRLFEDPLFRTFHRQARRHFGPGRIHPITSGAGYLRRLIQIDGRIVALRDAGIERPRYRGRADFVYFRLAGDEFLFVPAAVHLPAGVDRHAEISRHFRNTFTAFDAQASGTPVDHPFTEQSL
jgi:hypothetical protein